MIATPIWDKAEEVDFSPYEHTIYAAPAQRMREWIISKGRLRALQQEIRSRTRHRYALVAKNPPTRIAVVQNKSYRLFLAAASPNEIGGLARSSPDEIGGYEEKR